LTEQRWPRIVATVAVVALLVGCSPTVTPTPTLAPTPTRAAATPTSTPRVFARKDIVAGFIETGWPDEWHLQNVSSMMETAVADRITIEPYDPGGELVNQIAAFHRFDADPKVNVIVLDPVQAAGYDDVLREARAAGKVVVIEDRRIDADPSLYATYVGSDFVAQGRKAAAAMCDLLGNSAPKNVAEIGGTDYAAAEADRTAGFRQGMAACGMDIPAGLSKMDSPDASQSGAALSTWLKQTKDIQGVFAHSEEEATGAIAAIAAAGLKPGTDIQIVVGEVIVNCHSGGLKYLITGEVGAEIEYNPLLGPQVFDGALAALNGEATLPKWIPAEEGQFFASQGAGALVLCPSHKY
jgi:ABC-type sugar transport system substrate-binding protein